MDQKDQKEKNSEAHWLNLRGWLNGIRLFASMMQIAWMLRRRRLTDEAFLAWATRKNRMAVFWGFAGIGAQRRYGLTPAVKRLHAITYANNPDFEFAIYQHVLCLYEDEKWAEIAAVNIIPCLDGEDDYTKWTRQVHAYAQRQVDGSKGEFADD